MRTHGTLVKWNDERGFGFIAVGAGLEEVFIHVSDFPRDGMKPRIGEMLSFETHTRPDGKRKAVHVQRPAGPVRGDVRRPEPTSTLARTLRFAALVGVMVVIGAAAYSRWMPPAAITREALAPMPLAPPVPAGEAFRCDGRTECSQMHSCDEARYFNANCPDTRMDGDRDGEPCEQQWCQ